jgi:hypothetical protein
MNKIVLLGSFFLFCLNAKAQLSKDYGENLVPNPDFETLKGQLPLSDFDGANIFKYNIVDWQSPTKTTPDIKIVLPSEVKKFKEQNGFFLDKPHSGKNMTGIIMYSPESARHETYREYIQVKLKEPLRKGENYYCEFWICSSRRSKYISNNIGVVLSPTKLSEEGWNPLIMISPNYNYDKLINENGRGWERISFSFTSQNASQYLCIGNFLGNNQLSMREAKDPPELTVDEYSYNLAYFLIDDVLLCTIKK